VHLLSGDAETAVASLASQLHIAHYRAAATPEDKLAYVGSLQQGGARVLMVGDGVNDAPVLARADVSLAMGGGTDVARASGDMVLMGDELGRLPQALALAARSMYIIRQNLAWAAVYNLVALPLAMAGWVTPWLASLGMALSSLLVVSNALRLTKRSK
jgi:Cu2+-exporting ATPase